MLASTDLQAIFSVLAETQGNSDQFAETLRHRRLLHLSFSQISAVEFCPYRYYLQYVRMVDLEPAPDYLVKGKFLHQVIARSYEHLRSGQPPNLEGETREIDDRFSGTHRVHLQNALSLHALNLRSLESDCQVIAVEQAFAMPLADNLPPCVGVIDLILRRGDRLILIDHKTGRDFYPQDLLQAAIYAEYARRTFGSLEVEFCYEQYRWVQNLSRIRKPAFQRLPVPIPAGSWQPALDRMQAGFRLIREIWAGRGLRKTGACFRCPYRGHC